MKPMTKDEWIEYNEEVVLSAMHLASKAEYCEHFGWGYAIDTILSRGIWRHILRMNGQYEEFLAVLEKHGRSSEIDSINRKADLIDDAFYKTVNKY